MERDDDLSRELQLKLRKLAATGSPRHGTRRLGLLGQQSRLGEILREIDETVLPRRLVLERSDEEIVELTAANRCLFEIRTGRQGLLTLNPEDAETLSDARTPIERFLSPRLQVSLRTERPADTAYLRKGGISARSLAEHWGEGAVFNPEEVSSDAVRSFLGEHGRSVSAWCQKTGDQTQCGGDPARSEGVRKLIEETEQALLASSGHGLGEHGALYLELGPGQGASEHLVFARLGNATAVFLTGSSSVAWSTLAPLKT